jgi:hypothetical protein
MSSSGKQYASLISKIDIPSSSNSGQSNVSPPETKRPPGRPITSSTSHNVRRRVNRGYGSIGTSLKKYFGLFNEQSPETTEFSLSGFLSSPACRSHFPDCAIDKSAAEHNNDLMKIALNADNLLSKIGSHFHREATQILTDGVSISGRRHFFPSQRLDYIANSHIPSYANNPELSNHDFYAQQYPSDVKRKVVHEVEIESLLDWCRTHEFEKHSGDTTETYYRVDPKDCVYWDHYRGKGRGFIQIMRSIYAKSAADINPDKKETFLSQS